ncbi:NAD(P)/FAD-dependent oxidoreductase [Aliterella atlantica]|uniref:NAD(P)/FAD-dependent oxidoreductase n=1 Tax=Aliterella atlantica TaxID=1827278 RepID=UPI001910D27D|nr:FAD-dependent oxidoreductase [Aliterella atlantica]
MVDIVIIGAGMSGLVCAQQLHQAGYKVLVVEKSRGLGGRVATRRLHETCADRGTCYLNPKDELLQRFVELLAQQDILQIWTDTTHEFDASLQQLKVRRRSPIYTAAKGMSAIARFLATGLEIQLNQRVVGISTVAENWCLQLESTNATTQITAKAVVVAIPAPQALTLLEPIAVSHEFLANLRSVEFAPCISVIAGYPSMQSNFDWQAVTVVNDDNLAWIGLDSSKRAEK